MKDAASAMPADASRLYAKNVANLLALMTHDGAVEPDFGDDVVLDSCLTHDGEVRHPATAEALAALAALEPDPDATDEPGRDPLMDGISLLTITVLAVFVGFEVVSKVSSTLHTPLMSGANAIHGIILVGAIIVAGQAADGGSSRSRSSPSCWPPPTWSAASWSPTGCWRCSAAASEARGIGRARWHGRPGSAGASGTAGGTEAGR